MLFELDETLFRVKDPGKLCHWLGLLPGLEKISLDCHCPLGQKSNPVGRKKKEKKKVKWGLHRYITLIAPWIWEQLYKKLANNKIKMSTKPKQHQNILTLYIIFYGYGPLIFQLIIFRSKVLKKKISKHSPCSFFLHVHRSVTTFILLFPPHHYFR